MYRKFSNLIENKRMKIVLENWEWYSKNENFENIFRRSKITWNAMIKIVNFMIRFEI